MEAKKNNKNESADQVPTISIKEGSTVDSLDELLADFSEFVRQEDRLGYDNQVEKSTSKQSQPPRLSVHPFLYVRLPVCAYVQKLAPVVSQKVTNKSCLVCVKSEKYAIRGP